jgi:diacylglycerol kinase family enzyme
LVEEARRRRVETKVLDAEADEPAELARAADADAIGVAGGDGSLAPIAQVAIERHLPFVCIPFGTHNHFARDLGLDRNDPIAALDAFVDRQERRIDVGRVGDRLFLNNVSLGRYADLVHRREHHRRRRVVMARLRALGVLARHPRGIELLIDGRPVDAQIALVGNNRYKLDLFSLGERARLDEGRLHLALAGWNPTNWEERLTGRLTIDTPAHHVKAATDGEPAELETPLEFRIEPLALRVLVPRAPR